jgi:GDP-4-dehydro-6-deoxy-D-mannose reductase
VRILITGVAGFVGGHLTRHLLQVEPQAELFGTVLFPEQTVANVTCYALDLRDEPALAALIEDIRPDHIYHLAAQASPRRSFAVPWETLQNNIGAQLSLMLACLKCDLRPRFLVVSSAEVYGAVRPEQIPVNEDTPFCPASPYAVSKVAQDMLGLQYFLSHRLPVIRVRPFNHFGPGQSEGFVAPDFALQIARIEAGQQASVIRVGNLSAQRDFTDVRDVVAAYHLLMQHGIPGNVYNIASGRTYSIEYLLQTLLQYSSRAIEVQVDPARLLPVDIPLIQGDASRLRAVTGWQPTIAFEDTLRDVLDDCRRRVMG